jgi:hypothetical protein
MRTVTIPKVHYRADFADQNLCKQRRGRNWGATTAPRLVTCKRCQQLLKAKRAA